MENKKLLGIDYNDFAYLRPPRNCVNVRHTGKFEMWNYLDKYIYSGHGKKAARKIFHKVAYTDFEEENINALEKMVKEREEPIELPKDWLRSDYLKMLYNANFNLEKALKVKKVIKLKRM